jgi:hypothetical protein
MSLQVRYSDYLRTVTIIREVSLRCSVTLENFQPTFAEKLLRALREHVFNKMPIRLLCFEPHGSSFRISLFERGAIFAHLASDLRGKMHKKEFRPRQWNLFDERVAWEVEKDTIERLISKYARYAILSHTWLRTESGEVTYGDWNKGLLNAKDPGYRKLVNFCKAAWNDHRLALGWMDTVCINKESSAELDESIRSMYNWYARAAVCITYLAETQTLADMHLDPWFTRGWTLQELLAPEFVKFYNSDWKRFTDQSASDKNDTEIAQQIKRATTITGNELYHIREAPISRKMQLAATREVTREEDTAYSLMGIFNVSIPTAYGEGAERAFLRLLQEIIVSSDGALDLLNWAGDLPSPPPSTSRILPSSPKHYINRASNIDLQLLTPIEPLTLSVLGLCVSVLLMPGMYTKDAKLRSKPIGDYQATVDISSTRLLPFPDSTPITYNLLDKKLYRYGSNVVREPHTTFAVFNFSTERNIVYVPKRCIALGLTSSEPAGDVSNPKFIDTFRTETPIVFELSNRKARHVDPHVWYWQIRRRKLPKHGMQLISLYL